MEYKGYSHHYNENDVKSNSQNIERIRKGTELQWRSLIKSRISQMKCNLLSNSLSSPITKFSPWFLRTLSWDSVQCSRRLAHLWISKLPKQRRSIRFCLGVVVRLSEHCPMLQEMGNLVTVRYHRNASPSVYLIPNISSKFALKQEMRRILLNRSTQGATEIVIGMYVISLRKIFPDW